jgi:hypothetical protein
MHKAEELTLNTFFLANKLLIWCLAIIAHSAQYEILVDVYFVVLGICVDIWLRLMTFLIKQIFQRLRKKVFSVSSSALFSWGEQDTFVIMGRTRYI